MADIRERRRYEDQAELQEALDDTSERLRGADDQRVQKEIDALLEPTQDPERSSERVAGDPSASTKELSREKASEPRQPTREGDRLRHERDAVESRLDRAADNRRVQHEIERILATPERPPQGLEAAKERLERLDRISERDAMRYLSDFDPDRVRKLEDLEIQLSPEAFTRRHEGGLDPETERRLKNALRERD